MEHRKIRRADSATQVGLRGAPATTHVGLRKPSWTELRQITGRLNQVARFHVASCLNPKQREQMQYSRSVERRYRCSRLLTDSRILIRLHSRRAWGRDASFASTEFLIRFMCSFPATNASIRDARFNAATVRNFRARGSRVSGGPHALGLVRAGVDHEARRSSVPEISRHPRNSVRNAPVARSN